jgi:hypothetical protein
VPAITLKDEATPASSPGRALPLARGVFVMSIDTELVWGSFHRMAAADFQSKYGLLRDRRPGPLSGTCSYRAAPEGLTGGPTPSWRARTTAGTRPTGTSLTPAPT